VTPHVAVVIPTKDTTELTRRCVESVLAEGDAAVEIVIVDDGGTDDTAAALATLDPQLRVVRNATSLGFTRAANRGAAATAAPLLVFLNSDTELTTGALAEIARAFTEEARLGIAGASLHYPDGRPQWSAGRRPTSLWAFALASGLARGLRSVPGYSGALGLARRAMLARVDGTALGVRTVDWVSGAALAVRREVWETVGPFDERFAFYAQDLDLCLRANAAGWRVALLADAHVLHHHGATIGRERSSAVRQSPGLLWSDLVRWADAAGGARGAARMRRALSAGARCRLIGRAFAEPFIGPRRRAAHAAESDAYRTALRGLWRAG
jgi:GT2 family glycosyltransferase